MSTYTDYAVFRLIYKLPMYAAVLFIAATLALFTVSPMMPRTPNVLMVYGYGTLVMATFWLGFRLTLSMYGRKYVEYEKSIFSPLKINVLVALMLLVPMIVYTRMLQISFSYYGFGSVFSVFTDVGMNYYKKDDLIEEIGATSLGPFFAILNLLSFAQYGSYACLAFFWKALRAPVRILGAIAIAIQIVFFMSIGTMSGSAFLLTCLAAGFAASGADSLSRSGKSYYVVFQALKSIFLKFILFATLIFLLMVFVLTSRTDQIRIDDLFLFDQASIIYSALGHKVGDGLSMAISYVSQGWYGLGNAFELDFQWTYGLSSGRALSDYYYRFAGIENPAIVYSYPVRQESFSGYPAFAHWHTIFPWLASDFTFFGALVLNFMFAMFYGHVWLNVLTRKCPISISLFALLSIGVIFITANSQILDSKTSFLALIALLVMYLFRFRILKILGK